MKLGFKLHLLCDFLVVSFLELLQLDLIGLLELFQFSVLILDSLLFKLDQFLLIINLLPHVTSLFVLVFLILQHVRLQIGLHLFHFFNLLLLLLEHVFGVLELFTFVAKLVDLCLQFIRFLLLDHLHVSFSYFFDFG